MRADLVLDLKDSGSLWSSAEYDRCIDRAYADLTRYLPREKIYEESLQFSITAESFTTPLSTDADRIVVAKDLNGVVAGDTCTITAQPDVPRPITALLTDANDSITGLIITVVGFDRDGKAATEILTYSLGQSKSLVGSQYFDYISSITITQIGGTGGAGDTLDVGIGVYTSVWVQLANKPIKPASDTTSVGVRNTDYYIDYAEGRVKAISGGLLAANTAYTINYTKSQIAIDLSSLTDFIRVHQIEYPVGDIPQSFVQGDVFANKLFITGMGESQSQSSMAEDKHIRVYYDAVHIAPSDYVPGTAPAFLDSTIALLAGAYALLIYALKNEHQAITDFASLRTSLTSANTAHTALGTALANLKKYLDNNTNADAVGILANITSQAADLRTAIETALDAAVTYLTGATAPSVKKYLEDGDALFNTINRGGEGATVANAHRDYALASAEIVNGLVAEANVRLSNIVSYINQSAGYNTISNTFAREAEARIAEITTYLQMATGYGEAATGDMLLADRFRTEATNRRDEVYSIWRDRKQYIGDFAGGSTRQYS